MIPLRRKPRPRLEVLEGREVPADLTVTFSPVTHTLTVVGDDAANGLIVRRDGFDPTRFILSSGTDTFNGQPGPFETPSGVRNMAVRMLAGDDSVSFGFVTPIHLAGSLSVNGGDGANFLATTDLTVGGNLTVTNGTNATGQDLTHLTNLSVGGNVTVRNGDGDTFTGIDRHSAGNSTIRGNLTVTNGTGFDPFHLEDTDVGGNVTVKNGHGGISAGFAEISNFYNAGHRSVIRGSLTVTYLDGHGYPFSDILGDAEVLGNVTFNHGPGQFRTDIDARVTSLPVAVRGGLTITGTGASNVEVGTSSRRLGLVLGRSLRVATGAKDDVLNLNRLQVGGATRLALGNGGNTLAIDDSLFGGPFALATGAGMDTVKVETQTGTPVPTEFGGAVTLSLGAGADTLALGGTTDAGQGVLAVGTFLAHHGPGADTYTAPHLVFPFGPTLEWVN